MHSAMQRILLIDDNEEMRSMLGQMITEAGFEVVLAANGNEGIKHYRSAPTDLIITDIIMPEKGGLQTIVELRRDYPEARVIAMSGGFRSHSDDHGALAKILGVDRILAKPFSSDDLFRAVEEVLKD